jgi:hypothetical protein
MFAVKSGLVGKFIDIEWMGVAKVLKFNRVKAGWGKHQVQFTETFEMKQLKLQRDDNKDKLFTIVDDDGDMLSTMAEEEVGC